MNALTRFFSTAFVALLLTLFLTSCEAIGDIFAAGAYAGIIGTVVVIALIIWLISRLFGGGRRNV